MKKLNILITAAVLAITAWSLNGCILDAFKEIKQNMALERTFTVSGNTNSIVTLTQQFKLTDSQVYLDYRDKVKQLRYKAAAFCVSENTTPALQGNIILTLKAGTGTVLFTKTLTAFKPADYLGTQAKVLDLTTAEIDAINAYISNSNTFETLSFTSQLAVQNATPVNTNITMKSFISLALEMTIEP